MRLPLMLFYGQSWMALNSNNGRILDRNPFPDHAWMMGGQNAPVLQERGAITAPFEDFRPASDLNGNVQSVVTPFLYRYVSEALEDGRPATCVGYSGAVSGARLAQLLPEDDPDFEAGSHGFDNLMQAVDAHMSFAQNRGMEGHVPYLIFCQGAGDREMPKDAYTPRLERLIGTLQARIAVRTGQKTPPHIVMIQPPGKGNGGAWPCLQGQVELCARRTDMTLALAGWAIEQHDRTHFSGPGAVTAGELCAITARGIEQGTPVSAPYMRRARKTGAGEIEVEIEASGDMLIDTDQRSPRHRVRGVTVPNFGFELAGVPVRQISLAPRKLRFTFDADPPERIAFAYHAGSDFLVTRNDKANQSANRGNLRLGQTWNSIFSERKLYHWLASGYLDIIDEG